MKVFVYGNCQALSIATILKEIHPEFQVDMCEAWNIPACDMGNYENLVREADFVWCQPVARYYRADDRLSTHWIKHNVQDACKVFLYPVVFWRGYFPYAYSIHSIDVFEVQPQNVHVIDMFCAGMKADDIADECLKTNFLSPDLVLSEAHNSLDELKRRERDDQIDVIASDIIRDHAQHTHLLKMFNHPSRAVTARLLNRLLKLSEIDGEAPLSGKGYFPPNEIPIFPSIATGLNLSENIPIGRVVSSKGTQLFREHVAAFCLFYDNTFSDRQILLDLLMHNPAASAYLKRFKFSQSAK